MEMLNDMGSPNDWQKKVQDSMREAIPTAQKNVEEALQVMNQNTRTSLELLQKAVDTSKSESLTDAQAKATEIWTDMLTALRTNTQAMLQANSRMMESWSDVMHCCKNGASSGSAEEE